MGISPSLPPPKKKEKNEEKTRGKKKRRVADGNILEVLVCEFFWEDRIWRKQFAGE